MSRAEALIPNSLIEEMFLRVANDQEVETYLELTNNNRIALATSYASKKVKRIFDILVEKHNPAEWVIDPGSVELPQRTRRK